MKRWILLLLLGAVCLGAVLASFRPFAPAEPSLSRYVPPGALLYLEAKDFSSLLSNWNGSPEKKQWLHSPNYEVFSRSRLFLRLKDASDQFATTAGLPPNMQFLSQVAGSQSALALYDIGKLQFLYITKLDSGKAEQTALLQSRAKFETRSAAGMTFYDRKDAESGREVAFATTGDYLLLATREDLMAAALQLFSGNKGPTIENEPWWTQSVAAAGGPGDLRMVLNLEKIVPSPYFRSYWIQQNISDMKTYSASVSDLFLSGKEYREERVLVKKSGGSAEDAAQAGTTAVAELAQLVPGDAATYQVRSRPATGATLALLETKLLAPHPGPGVSSQFAPQVQLSSGETGSSGDLETRIDQPPLETRPQSAASAPLEALLKQNPVQASLNVQTTELDKDGVFVRFHTAVALLSSSDWDEAAVRSALTDFLRPALTASQLGVNWRSKSGYLELDGLWALALAVRGKYLFVSDDSRLLQELLSERSQKAATTPAVFISGFSHARERERFTRLTGLLDNQSAGERGAAGHMPEFFSENIASLSAVLARVGSEKIVIRDAGDKVLQTVTYEWAN
jgi:hypothetical protein